MSSSTDDQVLPSSENDTALLNSTHELARSLSKAFEAYADAIAAHLGKILDEAPTAKGSVQRGLLSQRELWTVKGASARELAKALGTDEPNTHTALRSLEQAGYVEAVGA